MKPAEHLASFTTDAARVTEIALVVINTTHVPTCPPWTVEDLLVHLSQIWAFVAGSIKIDKAMDRSEISRPAGSLVDWHISSSQALLEVCQSRDPLDSTWAFDLPDATVAFWMRRMCHEISVHRYDLEVAATTVGAKIDTTVSAITDTTVGAITDTAMGTTVVTPGPIPHAVAVDGIDELFDYFIPYRRSTEVAGNGETLHFHATSGHGEWLVTRTTTGIEIERKHAKGDVAVRSTASDLLLMLWGRISPSELEVYGDASLLAAWQDSLKL